MAVNPKTPGVYIDEIPVIPASVAGVSTAIPAFFGYVEKLENNGTFIPFFTPVRITSIMEYEVIFGKADGQAFQIDISDNITVTPIMRNVVVTKLTDSIFKLYYNMLMYFSNGGGPCYIVPLGFYSNGSIATVSKSDMILGLAAIEKVDEPTLLVFPDAVSLSDSDKKDVYDSALAQCQKLKDRFTIMDVKVSSTPNADATSFRTSGVGPDNLKYGAAYYPNLNTTLNFATNDLISVSSYKVNGVTYLRSASTIGLLGALDTTIFNLQLGFTNAKLVTAKLSNSTTINNFLATHLANLTSTNTLATVTPGALTPIATVVTALVGSSNPNNLASQIALVTGAAAFALAVTNYTALNGQTATNASALLTQYTTMLTVLNNLKLASYAAVSSTGGYIIGNLAYVKSVYPQVYNDIIPQINSFNVQLSPSGAMAGIYARVDNDRGVWKAPANVGVSSINGPSVNVTGAEQEDLNIDATSGKSINVIRSFTGRGTLVWGARTLAGNDNEWRYISVRRLYIYVEESIQEATEFVVFEPNTANTWFRVKGMIEAFLTGLWRDGALAGATTKEAFFVNVGLGTTMTADDILNGRMIVEVGMAAVRPAEFIILKFEHKLQES